MSVTVSGSTLVEVPGVAGAIEHLQELSQLMESDVIGFSTKDINNVDGIIKALTALHEECVTLHEKFEVETIKASILRHTLLTMPDKVKLEISDAVNAARSSDSNEQNLLQAQLKAIYEDIEQLHKRQKDLAEYNKVLYPRRDEVLSSHEKVIGLLNRRLAEKAANQIELNETKEQVREARHKIEDIVEDIQQLKEDLVQERAEARVEKKKLKKAVYDTTTKVQDQKANNTTKEKEMNKLHGNVLESDNVLSGISKAVRKLEKVTIEMKNQKEELEVQIAQQNNDLILLTEHSQQLKRKKMKIKTTFESKKIDLHSKVAKLEEELRHATAQNKVIKEHHQNAEEAQCLKTKALQVSEDKVKDKNDELRHTKEKMADDAKKIGYYRADILEVETAREELNVAHQAAIDAMKKRIQERRDQIDHGKVERKRMQQRRDSGRKEIEGKRTTCQKEIQQMGLQMVKGKAEHDALTKQGLELQKQLIEKADSLQSIQSCVKKAWSEYHEKKKLRDGEVKALEDAITEMTDAVKTTQDQLILKEVPFESLEEDYKQRSDCYDDKKKLVVSLKNTKFKLLNEKTSRSDAIDSFDKPTEKLKTKLKVERVSCIDMMKKHGEEVRILEENIYTDSCKLKAAITQNRKFNRAITRLEENISKTKIQEEETEDSTLKLVGNLKSIKEQLTIDWQEDIELEKEYAKAHVGIAEELGTLMDKTQKRERVILSVTEDLGSKLDVLGEFLDNINKRRPMDSSSDLLNSAEVADETVVDKPNESTEN